MDPAPPTLADILLPANIHLEVRCCECGRERRMGAAEAVARLGSSATVLDARRRLTCAPCRAAGRERRVEARPCSLDASAWEARAAAAAAAARGDRVAYDLEAYLASLQQLLGGRGALAGDGLVQWPVEGASTGL